MKREFVWWRETIVASYSSENFEANKRIVNTFLSFKKFVRRRKVHFRKILFEWAHSENMFDFPVMNWLFVKNVFTMYNFILCFMLSHEFIWKLFYVCLDSISCFVYFVLFIFIFCFLACSFLSWIFIWRDYYDVVKVDSIYCILYLVWGFWLGQDLEQ